MSQNNLSPSWLIPGAKSLLTYWIVLGLLGIFSTCLGYYLIHLDFFIHWSVFAKAPPNMAVLLGGDYGKVLVRTTAGQILSCSADSQECWIPDIDQTDQSGECNLKSAPFSPLTHPPRDLVECVRIQGAFPESRYTILYALDQKGNIWRWEKESSMEVLILPFLACLIGGAGILAGSVIWSVRRVLIKRSLDKYLTQEGGTKKLNWVWVLAALPLLCLIGFALYILSLGIFPTRSNNQNAPLYTSAAGIANAQLTIEASRYQAPVTPNPTEPAYDFVTQCQSAEWGSPFHFQSPCSGSHLGWEPSVDSIQIQEINGSPEQHLALMFHIPADEQNIYGRYPVWEVKSGDRFRAMLVCPADAPVCDTVFSLSLERQAVGRTLIGQWEVTDDQRTEEIDLDLSRFAGERVVFSLTVYNYASDAIEQDVLLVDPRIENIPGR